MPAKPDPRREGDTLPPVPDRPGSPDVQATLPPGQRDGDPSSAERTGPYGAPTCEPFPRMPAEFGRYRVVRQLGSGGMGTVYLAKDTKLDRLVALKVPHFTAADGPQARQRFLREARAAATLQHPNLCPVFDAGEVDGVPYLTMAFLDGKPLTELIREAREPLPERQVAALARKLALALAEAHARGVCHRDLKPGNIMLNARGEPVVMDFGLARRAGRPDRGAASLPGLTSPRVLSDACLTQAGALLGTPAYMAPEQAEGDPELMGPACDVYSLGVILYELLTLRLPFEGEDVFTLLAQVLTEPPRPPSVYRPGLDPRLEAICLKALAKRPEQRPRGTAEFAAVLTAFLTATSPATAELPAAPRAKDRGKENEPPRRHRRAAGGWPRWAWAGVVAGGVVLAAGTVLLARPGHGEVRVELSDPTVPVEVRVDGEPVRLDPGNPVLRLKVGQHALEVTGDGIPPIAMQFPVKRGDNLPVVVQLLKPPPTGSPELAWQPASDVREGKRRAPGLTGTWFRTDFTGARLFAEGKGKAKGRVKGHFPGGYYLRPNYQAPHFSLVPLDKATPPNPTGPFACEVVGRVTGRPGRWGLRVGSANGANLAMVTITSAGEVLLSGERVNLALRKLEPEPGKHPRVDHASGAFNRLLLIFTGRHLEVYVNHYAVCDPVLLDREVAGTPAISLVGVSDDGEGGTRAEFKTLSVAPANLRPLTERGAVPK